MSNSVTGSEIVVGVDGSAASDAAVRWAAREAAMRRLPLKLLHAVQPTFLRSAEGPTDDAITQSQIDHARRIVDASRALVDQLMLGTPVDVHTEVQCARIAPDSRGGVGAGVDDRGGQPRPGTRLRNMCSARSARAS